MSWQRINGRKSFSNKSLHEKRGWDYRPQSHRVRLNPQRHLDRVGMRVQALTAEVETWIENEVARVGAAA